MVKLIEEDAVEWKNILLEIRKKCKFDATVKTQEISAFGPTSQSLKLSQSLSFNTVYFFDTSTNKILPF